MAIKRLLVIAFCAIIIFAVQQTISGIDALRGTGILVINTSEPAAQISISQENHQAANIGTGNARIRLLPGTYRVAAASAGSQTSAVVTVYKRQTTGTSLDLKKNSGLHSVTSTNFIGTETLINDGLSVTQVGELEQYFFQYKPSVNTVKIDPASVEPGPHDPNTTSPFTLNFNVSIDSASYKAIASYTDLENITLDLYNPQTNTLVFTSVPTSQIGGD
jgi:hypothetical protein